MVSKTFNARASLAIDRMRNTMRYCKNSPFCVIMEALENWLRYKTTTFELLQADRTHWYFLDKPFPSDPFQLAHECKHKLELHSDIAEAPKPILDALSPMCPIRARQSLFPNAAPSEPPPARLRNFSTRKMQCPARANKTIRTKTTPPDPSPAKAQTCSNRTLMRCPRCFQFA